ncbi:hypothetical protein EVAR_38846_1 [Eumeta japonica]|uniref:Uncharacterized protein n=1 Tax=Eumeta variegata TaxID=151549 RepID=A0A4C1XTJ8_EUMVA|nr:hypothetical protein EVAR_38846_1 [Eumeta japonica]
MSNFVGYRFAGPCRGGGIRAGRPSLRSPSKKIHGVKTWTMQRSLNGLKPLVRGLGCLAGGGGCVYLCASYLYSVSERHRGRVASVRFTRVRPEHCVVRGQAFLWHPVVDVVYRLRTFLNTICLRFPGKICLHQGYVAGSGNLLNFWIQVPPRKLVLWIFVKVASEYGFLRCMGKMMESVSMFRFVYCSTSFTLAAGEHMRRMHFFFPLVTGRSQHTQLTARDLPCEGSLGDPLGARSHWNTNTSWVHFSIQTGNGPKCDAILFVNFSEPFDLDCNVVRRISNNIPRPTDGVIRGRRFVGDRCREKRIRVGLRDEEESLGCVFHIFIYCGEI